MSEQELALRKACQRRMGKAARQAIPLPQRQAADAAICRRILGTEAYQRAECLLVYAAAGGEVDLSMLAEQARQEGKHVAFPVCGAAYTMVAAEPEDDTAWEIGAYGIRAPRLERSRIWRPEELSLILVPCTAFDAAGGRIGMGGGYYDRYLPRCSNALCWAVAYECQRVERAATESHDRRMDAVITEWRSYGTLDRIQL